MLICDAGGGQEIGNSHTINTDLTPEGAGLCHGRDTNRLTNLRVPTTETPRHRESLADLLEGLLHQHTHTKD